VGDHLPTPLLVQKHQLQTTLCTNRHRVQCLRGLPLGREAPATPLRQPGARGGGWGRGFGEVFGPHPQFGFGGGDHGGGGGLGRGPRGVAVGGRARGGVINEKGEGHT